MKRHFAAGLPTDRQLGSRLGDRELPRTPHPTLIYWAPISRARSTVCGRMCSLEANTTVPTGAQRHRSRHWNSQRRRAHAPFSTSSRCKKSLTTAAPHPWLQTSFRDTSERIDRLQLRLRPATSSGKTWSEARPGVLWSTTVTRGSSSSQAIHSTDSARVAGPKQGLSRRSHILGVDVDADRPS
jgi:hypothetical protein